MTARRTGYTIIELLVVLAIIGVLATIVLPHYWDARHRATAANIVSDYDSVRTAALSFHAFTARLPDTQGWGVLPADFKPMLPGGFSFSRGAYEYRWQLWKGADLGGEFSAHALVAGLRVRSRDARLIEAVRAVHQGRTIAITPDEVMLLIR